VDVVQIPPRGGDGNGPAGGEHQGPARRVLRERKSADGSGSAALLAIICTGLYVPTYVVWLPICLSRRMED